MGKLMAVDILSCLGFLFGCLPFLFFVVGNPGELGTLSEDIEIFPSSWTKFSLTLSNKESCGGPMPPLSSFPG